MIVFILIIVLISIIVLTMGFMQIKLPFIKYRIKKAVIAVIPAPVETVIKRISRPNPNKDKKAPASSPAKW